MKNIRYVYIYKCTHLFFFYICLQVTFASGTRSYISLVMTNHFIVDQASTHKHWCIVFTYSDNMGVSYAVIHACFSLCFTLNTEQTTRTRWSKITYCKCSVMVDHFTLRRKSCRSEVLNIIQICSRACTKFKLQ